MQMQRSSLPGVGLTRAGGAGRSAVRLAAGEADRPGGDACDVGEVDGDEVVGVERLAEDTACV